MYEALRIRVSSRQYDELLRRQGGKCAICGCENKQNKRKERLAVDHDHRTGAIRGLLCGRCNTGLGSFADSPNLLAVAIAYLGRAVLGTTEREAI
jgi:hypothetical protein